MHRRKVLIIDDDKAWAAQIGRFLGLFNYDVALACTCAEGVKAVAQCRPDCVLLDFNLPDMDGCEAAFAIHGDSKMRKTPIIMASTDDSLEEAAYRDYHVDAFYYKMWPLERLRGHIEALLRRVDLERGNLRRGDLRLDGERLKVFHDSRHLASLSYDQFRVLSLLVSKAPSHVAENELIDYVFGEGEEEDKADALKMLIYRLRKSLGESLSARIKCVRGQGWQYLLPEDTPAR